MIDTAPAVAAGSTTAARARLWPLATGTFAIGFGSYIMAGLVPAMSDELGVSVSEVGWLVSVYGFTYAVSTPLLTLLTSRVTRRLLLCVAIGLFALTALGTALSTTYLAVAVWRGASAIVAGGFTPTATVLASRLAPPGQRGRALATVFGGLTMATVLGAPAGNLLGPALGYRGVYALVALLAGVSLVSVLLLVPSAPTASPRPIGEDEAPGTPDGEPTRRFSWLVAVVLAVSMLETTGALMVQTYSSPLLTEAAGLTGGALSAALLGYGLAGVLGNVAGGRFADRWGSVRVLGACLTVTTVALLLLAAATRSVIGAFAVFGVWGFAAWAMNSPLQGTLLALSGRHGQLVVALNSSVISLGAGLGALVGGLLVEGPGLASLGYVAAAVLAVAVLLVGILARRREAAGA